MHGTEVCCKLIFMFSAINDEQNIIISITVVVQFRSSFLQIWSHLLKKS